MHSEKRVMSGKKVTWKTAVWKSYILKHTTYKRCRLDTETSGKHAAWKTCCLEIQFLKHTYDTIKHAVWKLGKKCCLQKICVWKTHLFVPYRKHSVWKTHQLEEIMSLKHAVCKLFFWTVQTSG